MWFRLKNEPDLLNVSKEVESLQKKNGNLEKTMDEVSDEFKQFEKDNHQLQEELKDNKVEIETLQKANKNHEKIWLLEMNNIMN